MTLRPMSRRASDPATPRRTASWCAAALAPLVLSGLAAPLAGQDSYDGPRPVFENGEAQVVPEFSDPDAWIVHDLFVETTFDSDGDGKPDRMHVDVTRPRQTADGLKVAALYATSPYYAGIDGRRSIFYRVEHELGDPAPVREVDSIIQFQSKRPRMSGELVRQWVPRGFAVVHSSSPGTGLSQGCPTIGGENESLAPKAVIDWLNGRAKGYTELVGGEEVFADWCTGKVGMMGTSFNGTLPLAAATTGVEGLEAIIPVAPNTSYYHYYRSNGLVRHPGGYMGEDIDVLYDFVNSGNPERRTWCNREIRERLMNGNQDRVTGDYNEFWASRDYANKTDGIKAAVFMAHAFNDWNVMPEHSVRIYEKLEGQVPRMCYFHQGGHGGDPPFQLVNRWFTRYVYGVENGVENDPRAWIVRAGERRPTPYADYPNPDAAPVTVYPTSGGNAVGDLALEPGEGEETLVDDVRIPGSELAREAESPHRLLYATPELKSPVHISGHYRFRIRLAVDKKAANLSVWLVSLPWTGGRNAPITDNIISRGWADPQNHESMTESAPLEPGRFYDLDFQLMPDDQVIPAGQRIGLMIMSSDADFTLKPEPGTKLTVDLAATSLQIPVVGGREAFENAVGVGR